jgi:hypothetical protein
MAIDPNWTDIVAAFGAFGVVVLGIVTFWFYRKEHRLNGLVQAFKVLNNQEHRDAREMVYATFALYNKNKNLKIFVEGDSDGAKESTETVRADFDQMGALVQNGTIQKQGFLQVYGETTYRCWNALQDHIREEGKQRNFEHYMENFEWLSNEATKFWQKKGVNLTSIVRY